MKVRWFQWLVTTYYRWLGDTWLHSQYHKSLITLWFNNSLEWPRVAYNHNKLCIISKGNRNMGFKNCEGTQGLRNRDARALDAWASGGREDSWYHVGGKDGGCSGWVEGGRVGRCREKRDDETNGGWNAWGRLKGMKASLDQTGEGLPSEGSTAGEILNLIESALV